MDFNYSDKSRQLLDEIKSFMAEYVYPIEEDVFNWNHDPANLWVVPPQIEELKVLAKEKGLWNLFLPEEYLPYLSLIHI